MFILIFIQSLISHYQLLTSVLPTLHLDSSLYFNLIISFSFPSPTPPNASLFSPLLVDAAVIAVVTYVVSYSVGTVFAAKHGYEIRGAGVAQRPKYQRADPLI